MQQKNIHWFPGHMQKALREIETRVKIVDVVIELLDARIPFSSRNDLLKDVTSAKKRLIILTKSDLADPQITDLWKQYFLEQNAEVLPLDLKNNKTLTILKKKVVALGQDKRQKEINKGMKPQPIRAMIIGIPNVGKSTLINCLSKRASASVQNTPGHTRSQQWIKVGNDFELLDTPGVLPMVYDNKNIATKLALVGAIKQEILPISELSNILLDYLKSNYPEMLKKRYGIDFSMTEDNLSIFGQIAQKRGFLQKTGYDYSKAELLLLKEFKDGIIGKISLEKVGE